MNHPSNQHRNVSVSRDQSVVGVTSPYTRSDIVRGTNYLLESLGIDRRIRSTAEFTSPILIPIYEKICSCRLDGQNIS